MSVGFGRGGPSRFVGEEKIRINFKEKKILSKLLKLAKPFWKGFLTALIIILVIAGIEIIRPNIIRYIIDDNIQKTLTGKINENIAIDNVMKLGFLFLFLIMMQFVFEYLQIIILQKTGLKIILKLRNKLFTHIQKLPFAYFERIPVGVVVTRITNDTEAINEMYTGIIVNFLKELIVMIGIFIIIFIFNYKMGILLIILLPLLLLVVSIFRKYARKTFNEIRTRLAWVNAFLSEHISGIKIIKAFNMSDKKKKEFEDISNKYKKSQDKMVTIFGLFRPFIDFLNEVAIVVVLWFGVREFLNETLEIGMLYMFVRYTNLLFNPIIRISEMFNTLQSSLVASERIFDILELKPEKNYEKNDRTDLRMNGKIEFRNVWFSYDKKNWILKDISFIVPKGDLVAFVGATGAGKTTIINLLCGFYEIDKGEILIDDINISDISKRHLRENIGLVLQDVQLFNGNILSNIRLNSDISDEEVKRAAKHADAHEFIMRLSDGYNSRVYYGGSTLSNGERQLLSFARAIVKDPRILVLDEATSNVDTETERIIQNSLLRISKGRTTVAIAHRLSTIKNADNIIVIHKGKIIETGDHEALMKKKGLYFNLYSLQFSIESSAL